MYKKYREIQILLYTIQKVSIQSWTKEKGRKKKQNTYIHTHISTPMHIPYIKKNHVHDVQHYAFAPFGMT